MKKNILITIIITIIMIFTSNIDVLAADKVILIDPGHGGFDGGAKSKAGTIEKDINLAISKALKESLQKKGYKVEMTREDDIGLYTKGEKVKQKKSEDLANRCKKKKEVNCDVFISIHQNSFPQSKYYGAQVWHANNEKSKKLAETIQGALKSEVDNENNRQAKNAEDKYKILRDGHEGANVIVECGFLSNEDEDKRLNCDEYQKKLADAIVKGVEDYYSMQ